MPDEKITKIAERQRSLAVSPPSVNDENRTVDVVFATENKILTRDWRISERSDGMYWEILSCDSAHVRMDRLIAGAPVLDHHQKWSIKDQLGVVDNARIESSEGRATIRFSKRAEVDPVWQDIKDGIIRNISAGYRVYAYQVEGADENQIPILRAVDWEPTEISLATVPADPDSRTRSDKSVENQVIINQKVRTMSEEVKPPAGEEPPAGTPAPEAPPAGNDAPVAEAARTAVAAERTRVP